VCFVNVLNSRRFLTVRDYCPSATLLGVFADRVLGHRVLLLPILTSPNDVPCAHSRWSLLATWPPHFRYRLQASATMSFALPLCLQHLSLKRVSKNDADFHIDSDHNSPLRRKPAVTSFMETRSFITVFAKSRHWIAILTKWSRR